MEPGEGLASRTGRLDCAGCVRIPRPGSPRWNAPSPNPTPPATPAAARATQVALGLLLALPFGLLAFRGYGNRFGAKPTQRAPALTDLNRADRAELEQVPGIGPGLAKQIDDHRRAKGPSDRSRNYGR